MRIAQKYYGTARSSVYIEWNFLNNATVTFFFCFTRARTTLPRDLVRAQINRNIWHVYTMKVFRAMPHIRTPLPIFIRVVPKYIRINEASLIASQIAATNTDTFFLTENLLFEGYVRQNPNWKSLKSLFLSYHW